MKYRRERVFEQAVDNLRTKIENGEIKTGDRLPPEPELSDQFQIGRSSVREAIRILEAEGLVEILRGRGTFVSGKGSWHSFRNSIVRLIKENELELLHLLEAREGLEGMAVFLVAQNPQEDLINELTTIVNEMEGLTHGGNSEINFDEVARLNTRFHSAISQASGNPIIHQLVVHLLDTFAESNKAILFTGSSVINQVKEHRQIIKEIENGNPIGAEKVLRNHINRVRTDIREMSEDQKASTDGVEQS